MITFPLGDLPSLGKIGAEGEQWARKQSGGLFSRKSGRGTGMLIHLHSQATTTPKLRALIQESHEVGTVLAG